MDASCDWICGNVSNHVAHIYTVTVRVYAGNNTGMTDQGVRD